MMRRFPTQIEFEALRPRLLLLLELHRAATTENERATLVELFEDVFLATASHVAQDLLEHGWRPGVAAEHPATRLHLKVVGGTDAA